MRNKPVMCHRSVIILCAVLISVCGYIRTAPAIMVDKIVAVVNGEIITQSEVTRLLIPYYENYKKEYTGDNLAQKMSEAETIILEQLIDDKLILAEAKRREISVSDDEINEKMKTVQARFPNEEAFRQALSSQNVTLGELRQNITNELIKSKLIRAELGKGVTITPAEVHRYYDSHPEDFSVPARAHAYNLLVKRETDARTPEESRFLIEQIYGKIAAKADFRELAREYSEGPNASRGGDLGWVEEGQMLPEIDTAIFSMEAPGISGIIESDLGYHIVWVPELAASATLAFEDCCQDIEDILYRKKLDRRFTQWLSKLRKRAYISIK